MHVVVLLKQVLDPEIPAKAFDIDQGRKAPKVERAPQVLSIFDGNALELALKLREARADVRITALTLGPQQADEALRKALALTCDEAVRVDAEEGALDSHQKARLLAAALRLLEPWDLVLAGRQAADWEAGQVGAMVAEELALPCVPFVSRVEQAAEPLAVRQQLESGYAVVQLGGPAVLTVTNDETNVLRAAKVKDVMAAGRKPLRVLQAGEILADLGESAVEVLSLALPPKPERAEIVEGGSMEEKASALARRLRELGAI